MAKFTHNLRRVEDAFDRDALADICEMHETDFGDDYGMTRVQIDSRRPEDGDDFYYFLDHGSRVLAVAHLDTVADHDERKARFLDTAAGEVVYSRALDDRLGAYTILELLPDLGIQYDILLTVGEEMGSSTAEFFDAPEGRTYDWIIEFDRGGTDVVLYQYEDKPLIAAVRATGAHVEQGIFSDISYMEHMGTKALNWGVGYRDYHGPKAHAYLDDYFEMIARYLKFHQQNEGKTMPHDVSEADPWYGRGRGRGSYGGSWSSAAKRALWSWDQDTYRDSCEDEDDGPTYRWREYDEVTERSVYVNDEGDRGYFDEDDMWHYEDEVPGTYSEPVYFESEYNEDPTLEEIQAALAAIDDDRARWLERQGIKETAS